ncbi:MAG: DUF4062 domain-containing protein [Xanthobacteraceae bacterium]
MRMAQTTHTVFVSSTAEDLADFRDVVHDHLTRTGMFICTNQRTMGGRHAETVASCIDHAANADFYIGLIGMRRGCEPDGDAKHRSITEIEYDSAKPDARFVYITNERFPVPGNLRETDEEHRRQLDFRSRVTTRIVAHADFSSPATLAAQIVRELLVHVQRQPRSIDPLASLSDAVADRILERLDKQGVIKKAERGGLEREIVLQLAKRLKPDDVLDFDRAVAELENAITIALDAIARGRRGSNEGKFVNDVLKSVAAHTQAGENQRAAEELDDALKELDAREEDQRENLKRSRLTLLEAGIEQDILRRDALSAASRVNHSVAVKHPDDAIVRFAALRKRRDEFYVEGRDKGVNFSLDIAIEIARRTIEIARDGDQRGIALNDLGIALKALGERESGAARLDEAVATYREALTERTRKRAPLDWAVTQNNLGNALRALGERESGTARLDEAVAAYREALTERTRELVPHDWAMTQNNLGNALRALGERESGTARLDEAVAAFREALAEWTRELVPLQWAMTQHNLGNALAKLGERESGTARLHEAVVAYREALTERTRKRVPLDWAMSTGDQGVALMHLSDRRGDAAMAATAVNQIDQALAVMRETGHEPFAQFYQAQLPEAHAIRDRLNKA